VTTKKTNYIEGILRVH